MSDALEDTHSADPSKTPPTEAALDRILFDFFGREMPAALRRSTATRPVLVQRSAAVESRTRPVPAAGRSGLAIAAGCLTLAAAVWLIGQRNASTVTPGRGTLIAPQAPSGLDQAKTAEERPAALDRTQPGGPVESRVRHVGIGDEPTEPGLETELPELLIEIRPIEERTPRKSGDDRKSKSAPK